MTQKLTDKLTAKLTQKLTAKLTDKLTDNQPVWYNHNMKGGDAMNARKGGRYLKSERESRKLSQLQVCELIGTERLSQQTLSRMEEGYVIDPSFEKLVLLGRLYGIDANALADIFEIPTVNEI